jgi:archaellum biogenesis protein FlaJ (TadC family)
VPEELRGPIGVALYVAIVTIVYWFVSDEIAGTLLLVFLALAAVVLVVLGWMLRRPTDPALEIEEEPVVTTSAWPLLGATAAMLIGLGLLYGPWLWVPGAALAAGAAYGWITQTDA